MQQYGVTRSLTSALLFSMMVAGILQQQALAERTKRSLTVGVRVASAPSYLGSDTRSTSTAPNITGTFGNFFYSAKGVGYNLINSENWTMSIAIAADSARKGKNIEHLTNIKDIPAVGVTSVTISYQAGFVGFGLHILQRTGGDKDIGGGQAVLSVSSAFPIAASLVTSLKVGAHYANKDYMDTWFKVDTEQANLSSIKEYDPDAGIYSNTANVSFTWILSEGFSVLLFTKYTKYQPNAADSPLILQDHGTSYGIGLNYRFIKL